MFKEPKVDVGILGKFKDTAITEWIPGQQPQLKWRESLHVSLEVIY